jgi:cyclophilin family peptidyl-prolyl cis-trans isomerase
VSGKQHKRDAKRQRDAAREAARRKERQRTIQTAIVVAIAVALGGVIIFLSLQDPQELADTSASEGLTDPATELPSDAASDPGVEPCVPAPPPTDVGEKQTYPDVPAPGQLAGGTAHEAVIETTCGRMVFKLLEDDAPETVNSFVFLAREGFFDGLQIFRNEPSISILQTGAGDNSNTWDIGYTIPDELGRAEALGYTTGSLAMANSGPDTSGSQFFMVYGDSTLPPDYTLFGQLVEGEQVLRSIGAIPNGSGDVPATPAAITSVTIQTYPEEPPGPNAPVEVREVPAEPSSEAPAEPSSEVPAEPSSEVPAEPSSEVPAEPSSDAPAASDAAEPAPS